MYIIRSLRERVWVHRYDPKGPKADLRWAWTLFANEAAQFKTDGEARLWATENQVNDWMIEKVRD